MQTSDGCEKLEGFSIFVQQIFPQYRCVFTSTHVHTLTVCCNLEIRAVFNECTKEAEPWELRKEGEANGRPVTIDR